MPGNRKKGRTHPLSEAFSLLYGVSLTLDYSATTSNSISLDTSLWNLIVAV